MEGLLHTRMGRRAFIAAGAAAAGGWALRGATPRALGRTEALRALVHDETHHAIAAGGAATMRSPFPFTHVGLHWKGEGGGWPEAQFEARTSPDGLDWSPWQATSVEAGPANTSKGETFAALLSASRHRYLQYRASVPDGASLTAVTATFLNTMDGPAIEASGIGIAGAGSPVTFSREDWGADESLRFNGSAEVWRRSYVHAQKIIVHHTVTSNDYANEAAAKAAVRAIYTYHTRTLGWGDIAYNALVDRFGNTYEGRYGRELATGREVLSDDVGGGHAADHNFGTMGVALLGTFCAASECGGSVDPSASMVEALRTLLVRRCRRRNINPQARRDFLLASGGWNRDLMNIAGHRDCNPTICPGGRAYELLPSLREEVAEELANGAAPAIALATYPPQDTDTNGRASYTWAASGAAGGYDYSFYLEGWYRPQGSAAVSYLRGYTADRRPAWSSWASGTVAVFNGLPTGHYTFHVRARDRNGVQSVYQDVRSMRMENDNPVLSGAGDADCDGEISSIDSALVLQSEAGLLDGAPCAGADVTGDGRVNSLDALLILQHVAGLHQLS